MADEFDILANNPARQYGDSDEYGRDLVRREEARMTAQSLLSVAPGQIFRYGPGKVRHEGDTVQWGDAGHDRTLMHKLVDRGIIIWLSDAELLQNQELQNAEYMVDPNGQALTTSRESARGIVSPGQAFLQRYLARDGSPAMRRVDPRTGVVMEVQERPPDDGKEAFEHLIERGRLVRNPAYQGPKEAPKRRKAS